MTSGRESDLTLSGFPKLIYSVYKDLNFFRSFGFEFVAFNAHPTTRKFECSVKKQRVALS